MHNQPGVLLERIRERITVAGSDPRRYMCESSTIVVFGSVAAGLERSDSDIDVLCIGRYEGKLKTDRLDLVAISETTFQDRRWRQSELAGHIFTYGVGLKGLWQPPRSPGSSEECIEAKRLRVTAFLRRLPQAWEELDVDFRIKYALKVRREVQRLMLLESGIAVPPTRVLDDVLPNSPEGVAVCDRMRKLAVSCHSTFLDTFLNVVRKEWNRHLSGSSNPN